MPRITKVYTKTGDKGTTGLGGGQRVSKDSLRIDTYGTVDELNSVLGMVLISSPAAEIADWVRTIQNELFHLGSDLCILEEDKQKFRIPQIEERHVFQLEKLMDCCAEELKPLEEFILPGGSNAAAHLHLARTVCRRAERLAVALSKEEPIGPMVVAYLNRLSDALFVFARMENHLKGVSDIFWDKSL